MDFSKLVENEQKEVEKKLEAEPPKPKWQEREKTFSQVVGEVKFAPGEARTLDIEQNVPERETEEPMACFRSASQLSVGI